MIIFFFKHHNTEEVGVAIQSPQTDSHQQIEYVPIKVTAGILLHIGAGIYNSVAGAIKELVSNSFDADATNVVISTNYPYFNEIKVVDNGIGMSSQRLKQAMQTIGSSLKGTIEPQRISKKYDRPIIGHLGIGLMALSQVCAKAKIESQEKGSESKFVAELDFSEFKIREKEQTDMAKLEILRDMYGGLDVMKELLDNPAVDVDEKAEIEDVYNLALEAQDLINKSETSELEGEHLGYCIIYPELPAISGEYGTTIILTNIDQGVKDLLSDRGRTIDALPNKYSESKKPWDEFREEVNSWSWKEMCQRLNHKTNRLAFQSLPQYHQFIWELSLMTPIEYFDDGPISIDDKILKSKKEQLKKYYFSLKVDNRKLTKPIILPSGAIGQIGIEFLEEGLDYVIRPVVFDDNVDNDALQYHGYLFWQRQQNEPSTVRGVQIYVRNVGIGLYDHSLLNFSTVNPTSRAGQISSEIYVDEGLERALSVDRNSFKETDAHFITLQQHIWRLLGSTRREDGILGASVDSYYKRKEQTDSRKQSSHVAKLEKSVTETSKGKLTVSVSKEKKDQPYVIQKNKIIVYDKSPTWPRAVNDRHFYQKIIIPVKVAVSLGASAEDVLLLLEKILLNS